MVENKLVHIRISQVPEGPAPKRVRVAWIGVELWAERVPEGVPEIDFVTGERIRGRTGFRVEKETALRTLFEAPYTNQNGYAPFAAATWFHETVPSEMSHFTFGPNEVEILPEDPSQTLK